MRSLLNKVNHLGLFSGELDIQIGIKRAFEGYSCRATETWETQYTFKSNEITGPTGEVIFPALSMKSKSFESFDKFINRVEDELNT